MFNSFRSSSAPRCASDPLLAAASSSWTNGMDDVALGCESADPSLHIDCWGQDEAHGSPAVGDTN